MMSCLILGMVLIVPVYPIGIHVCVDVGSSEMIDGDRCVVGDR